MKLRKQTKQWTMRDGRKIRICDMTLDHLKNTMGMLERGAQSKHEADLNFMLTCPEPNGDMASVEFDNMFDEQLDKGMGDYLPEIYWDMMDDLERREMEERKIAKLDKLLGNGVGAVKERKRLNNG